MTAETFLLFVAPLMLLAFGTGFYFLTERWAERDAERIRKARNG